MNASRVLLKNSDIDAFSKTVLLLTACVNPNGMSFTILQNSNERMRQYKSALKWYLENTSFRIVFVENTMTDLSGEFEEYINSGRLEYITFDGNNFDRRLGKGYGEAMILGKALELSGTLKNCSNIIKVTGRLILTNINKLSAQIDNTDTIFANTLLANGKCLANSYVFFCPPLFLKEYFLPNSGALNDEAGYYFEHLLYDSILRWRSRKHNHKEFKSPLKINGLSASSGLAYYRGGILSIIKAWLKWLMHSHQIYKNTLNLK